MSRAPFRLERLTHSHVVSEFSSGHAAIDDYLRVRALAEQTLGLASVTVAVEVRSDAVIGFFSLSPLSIRIDARVLTALGVGAVPYPSVGGYLLGRLGVEKGYQGRTIGQALVAVATDIARTGRKDTGGVFLAVDAKSDSLVGWYEQLGFSRLGPNSHRCLMLL